MKKILIATTIALIFTPACFSQEKTEAERVAKRPNFLLRSRNPDIIDLEEDSARINIEMKKTHYERSESAIIQITLKNVSTKSWGNPYMTLDANVHHFYDIVVTDPTGRKVPQLTNVDMPDTGGQPWGLGPGQTQKASVWLNKLFGLVDVGKYKVVVSKKFRKDGEFVTVSSEPLEFEITSGKPVGLWY